MRGEGDSGPDLKGCDGGDIFEGELHVKKPLAVEQDQLARLECLRIAVAMPGGGVDLAKEMFEFVKGPTR